MSVPTGPELGRRREVLGLTLAQVSAGTGLTVSAIEALESGKPHRLTRGHYGDAYVRTYATFLHRVEVGDTAVPEPSTVDFDAPSTSAEPEEAEREEAPPPPPKRWVPLPAVRAVAVITTLLAVGLVGWRVRQEWRSRVVDEPSEVVVRLVMQRNAHLRVEVDGVLREDRLMEGREVLEVRGRRQVDVDVPAVEVVRVWFNGRAIEPRGQVASPRRLSFRAGLPESP